ncbi:MAG: ubiquinone/menaquinone biosynthesis methyltransferase [Deltaproteobacteria bacterium]|nr:ubiquinone/menaquinone biosynthesis methyltransferase [Deltaproteobacteria bacterium]
MKQIDAKQVQMDGSGAMFDAIAERYDGLNRVISLGLDQSWRRRTVRALALETGQRVLDVATGTADLALMAARLHEGVSFVGVDPSTKMVEIGVEKVERAKLGGRVVLRLGDACALPAADASFDAAMMAFGIRNVADRPRALEELARVVRPGGRIAILEASEASRGILAPLARFHSRVVVPRVASLFSSRKAYEYLETSIRAFPPPEVFRGMMEDAGLQVERVDSFTFGVVSLYVAVSRGPVK